MENSQMLFPFNLPFTVDFLDFRGSGVECQMSQKKGG